MKNFYKTKFHKTKQMSLGLIKGSRPYFILLIPLFLFNHLLLAEGTKSIAPSTEDAAALFIGAGDTGERGGDYGLFGWKDSNSKLFFNVQNTCEKVYIGFSLPKTSRTYSNTNPNTGGPGFSQDLIFRILDPTGQALNDLACFGNTTIDGEVWQTLKMADINIADRAQADAGPSQLAVGGYDAFELDLSGCGLSLTGNYSIEFFTTNQFYDPNTAASGFHIEFFDITVADCNKQGQTGRVWSNNWSLSIKADGDNAFDRAFNGAFFVCSQEGFISKIDFNTKTNNRAAEGKNNDQQSGFRAGAFNVSFNTTGPKNTGNILTDRLSVPNSNSPNPQLPVFLNLPNESLCPEQPIGQLQQMENFVTGCADSRCINFATTQLGQLDILLERLDGNRAFDQPEEIRIAYEITEKDLVLDPEREGFVYQICVPWNGQDALGNVWDINDLKISGFFRQGVYHFPSYDAEFNDDGFLVETVRPALGFQEIYYNDTAITEENNTGEPKDGSNGCVAPCHRWTGEWAAIEDKDLVYGNFNTINTWWFGNTVFQEFQVEQIDPLTLTCPPDVSLCFGESTDPTATGQPAAALTSSACVQVSFSDVLAADPDCEGGQLLERTWISFLVGKEDEQLSCTQRIKIAGQTPPTFSNVPADLTIACDEIPTNSANVTAISPCENIAISTDFSEMMLSGDCPNTSVLRRTWTATDACGNIGTAVQLITISDREGPTFAGDLADINLECGAPTPSALDLNLIDNCDNPEDLTLTFSDQVANNSGRCAGEQVVIRTYTARDQCGNATQVEQRIVFQDNTPPVLENIPANKTMSCDEMLDAPNSVTATDNCDAATDISIELTEKITEGNCIGNRTIERTWTATDGCGNASTAQQLIFIEDNTPPTLQNIPANLTVSCDQIPEISTEITAMDNCETTADIVVEFTQKVTKGNCLGNQTIERTWRATDGCGNSTVAQQLIIIEDNTPPTLQNIPVDLTISCEEALPVPPNVTATDNCSGATVTFSEESAMGLCPSSGGITRIWTATDGCGNSMTALQKITIIDTTPPQFLECGKTIKVVAAANCLAANVPIVPPKAVDNCDGTVSMTASVDVRKPFPIGVSSVIFTATDACGNTTTCAYRIEVENPPSNTCPADIEVACNPTIDGTIVSWEPPNGNDCCSSCSEETAIIGYTYLGMRGGHRYYLSKKRMDWSTARKSADNLGGTLAIINDAAENSYLSGLVPDDQSAFIGLSDVGSEGNFYWEDGSPLLFTNWVTNQPNNKDGIQHYGQFLGDGRWNDAYATNEFLALVEIVCADVRQVSGPMNGGKFEAGVTTIAYEIDYDNCPNSDFCEFTVTVKDCPLRYCESSGRDAKCFWIDRIQFADLDHSSGSDNGYADYTDVVANLTPGKTETMLLKPGFQQGHLFDLHWTVFIDYNRDGDFDDEGEFVLKKFENRIFHKKGDGPVFQDFTVPADATPGPTRMRIAMKFTENINPCEKFSFGEVQDYTVNILPVGNDQSRVVRNSGGIFDDPEEVALIAEEIRSAKAKDKLLESTSWNANQLSNQQSTILQIQLYPNPVKDGLSVRIDGFATKYRSTNGNHQLTIYNHQGQIVQQKTLSNDTQQFYLIDVRHFVNGLYFLEVEDGVGERTLERFTKF